MRSTTVGVLAILGLGCPGPVADTGAPPPRPAPPPAASPGAPAEEAPAQVVATPTGALASVEEAHQHLLTHLRVGFYRPRHKDNEVYAPSDGYLAPVARTSDGGFVFGGQVAVDGETRPALGKVDGDGELLWLVPMDRPTYRAYEGGLINETPDGHYVGHVMSYVDPSGFPVYSFAKLTRDGEAVWTLELPRDEHGNTPQVHIARVAPDSSIELQGHLYRGPRRKTDRPAYRWAARVTADGALTDVATGAPIDWAKDEW